ncbi:MAG: glycosyltransferase family 4 protein, partial [Chlorobi bacterium]|nr:glycosyltransferase family 4 protein [Chlorobiota bacterium]
AEQAMREKAKELGLTEKICIVHSVPHADIPFYINAMDLLVLPSYTVPHWKEQFVQVLVQAMASEVPVIGSTHAEIPNVIGNAGLIFPEHDVEQLGEALRRLVEDEGLRRDLGEKGRERVLAHYTNTKIAEATYAIYHKLLEGDETCVA